MKNNSVELEDPSLYNLHGIIRPGTEHQQQLKKKKKKRKLGITCLLRRKHNATYHAAKGPNLNPILPLDPAANFQKIPKKGEHVELLLEYTLRKIQTVKNLTSQVPGSLTDKP